MRSVFRRHPIAAFAAALVLLAAGAVALAPWWIDLKPVRARIERAASSALAGTLTYERMDLSWFPRPEVVVRSARVSVPGVRGTVRSVRVSPSVLPLLRGRIVFTRIGVEGLDLAVDLRAPAPETRPASPADSGWTQALRSLGTQTLDVTVDRSRIVLARPEGRSLTFEGIRVEAALRVAEGKADLTLSRLSMESPALAVEGNLHSDTAAPLLSASARGSDLDVADVRAKLLSFLGDDATVAEIFEIVRGGRLTSFNFASAGKSPGDLGSLEKMTIRAAVADAKVRIAEAGLDLTDVSGDAALEGGVLTAENATARAGKSRASGGRVLVGLAPGDGRLRVEAQVRADLAELPAILTRAIDSRTLREELALVEGLEGSATGRITLEDREGELETSVSVSEMRFSAGYRRLPWPVRVEGGEFTFDGKRAGVSRLSGNLGRSTFEGVAARVRLGREAVLESASGSLVVSLEDFLGGVRSRPDAAALARNVLRMSGSVEIDLRRLAGPLARLAEVSVAASGTFKEILLSSSSSSSLPPLSIASGRFTASDDAILVEDADTRALDAALRVSGVWSGWRGKAPALAVTADGEIGAEAVRWGWERAALPVAFRPAAPIDLHGGRFSLGSGALTLAGDFVVGKGPRVALDMTQEGGKTDVRSLRIADGDAVASMGLRLEAKDLDVRFEGRLAASTLAKLFGERPWRSGALEGNVRVHFPLASPGGLTADGAMTATNFELPTPAGPVTVERLDARASGSRVDVTSSSLVLGEQRFTVKGSATLEEKAVALDMDMGTGDLAWTRVEKVLGRLEEAKKEKDRKEDSMNKEMAAQPASGAPTVGTHSKASSSSSSSASLSIRGDVRVSLDSFTHGNLVFRPVLVDVRLGADSVAAHVRKADLCGIAVAGEARFLSGGAVALDARADATGPDVNVPLTCLGLENARMTGDYEASVKASGEAPASELVRSLRGPLTFKATKGRIGKATILTRILGVVNATDVFAGKDKTRVGDAIPYDVLTLEGELSEGTVSIREAALKAPSITMAATGTVGLLDQALDLMVLAHPLSTVDKVVQAVPVVRNILGRDFLAVAVKVTGTVGDPVARVTPARDVGKGLIGILERTVTLPVTVFEPPPEGK